MPIVTQAAIAEISMSHNLPVPAAYREERVAGGPSGPATAFWTRKPCRRTHQPDAGARQP